MDKKELFSNFQNNWGRLLSPFEIEEINVLIEQDNISLELINEALRQSVLYHRHNMPYVVKILKNWKSRDILTIERVREHEEARDALLNAKTEVSAEFVQMLIGAAEMWGSDDVKNNTLPHLQSLLAARG